MLSLLLLATLAFATPAHHGDGASHHQPAQHAQAEAGQHRSHSHPDYHGHPPKRHGHPNRHGGHRRPPGHHHHRRYRDGRETLVTTFWIGPVFIRLVSVV